MTPAASRRPVVERIAGWSARHRKTAVFGWLLLVAVIFVAGQALGGKSVPGYSPGQAGQAERALHQLTGDAAAPARWSRSPCPASRAMSPRRSSPPSAPSRLFRHGIRA